MKKKQIINLVKQVIVSTIIIIYIILNAIFSVVHLVNGNDKQALTCIILSIALVVFGEILDALYDIRNKLNE